ncbi:MAG TPA: hypothetical protein P5239_10180 [Victivallales bacterium]|nr:hypothetical protein [Victivallales bacterium]
MIILKNKGEINDLIIGDQYLIQDVVDLISEASSGEIIDIELLQKADKIQKEYEELINKKLEKDQEEKENNGKSEEKKLLKTKK